MWPAYKKRSSASRRSRENRFLDIFGGQMSLQSCAPDRYSNLFYSGSHAFLEGTGGQWETEMVPHILDAVGAGEIEVAVGALGLDDQRRGLPAHDFAVTLRIADVNQQLDVTRHVQIARRQVGELHRPLLPARLHPAQRHTGADHEIVHVTGINAGSDVQKTRLPVFPFPAVRRIGIDSESRVAVANFHEQVEVVGAHRGRARMDFMAKIETKFLGMLAQSGGFFHETILAFLDKVIIAAGPEAPGITGGQFPAECRAPEHRNDLHTKLSAQIQ